MSSTAEDLIRRHRFTVEDYYRMADDGILAPDARVELIDGAVIELPPIGAPHASVVTDIQKLLIAAVGDRAIVRVQNPVRLGQRAAAGHCTGERAGLQVPHPPPGACGHPASDRGRRHESAPGTFRPSIAR